MSIFTKPLAKLVTADVQELLDEKAVENIRLEFKSNVPDKDETLKKLSSFANSFGGFMVVGAKANSADGRIESLPGVDEVPGYKQKVVQWCFDAVSPPLIVEVSDAIPSPDSAAKLCYVVYTAESEVAPHFLNGRKGVWVRTDEFSQHYEPQLATENELRYLLNRRQLTLDRRTEVVQRSRRRFEKVVSRRGQGSSDASHSRQAVRLQVSVGPRFPSHPVCTQPTLVDTFTNCLINWRDVGFPRNAAKFVTQHESILSLADGETNMMVEANIWGMLFYGTELDIEINLKSTSMSGIHLYGLVGYLLVFAEHANQMTSHFGRESPLSFDVTLSGVLGVPWLYSQDIGGIHEGPKSPLDDEFSFSLPTTTEELRKRPDALVMSMLQYILFAMNWSDFVNKPGRLESLLRSGYKYNSWGEPKALRL